MSTGHPDAARVEHKMAMDASGFAGQVLSGQADYLQRFLEAAQSVDSSLQITDPTLYRDVTNDPGFEHQARLARAAVALVLEVQTVKEAAEK